MKVFNKVQNRLFILFLFVAAIPMTILASTLLIYNTTYLKNYSLNNKKMTAQTATALAQQFLNHAKEDIESVAKSPIVMANMEKGNISFLADFIENFQKSHKFFVSIAMMDSEGYVQAIYPENSAIIGNNLAYQKYFIEVMKTEETYLSNLVNSEPKEDFETVVVAVPVRDKLGNILGLALGHIDLSKLTNILREASTSASAKTILIDRKGEIVSHPDAKMITKNAKEKDNWAVKVLAGTKGVSEEVNAEGEKILYVYLPITGTGWGLAIEEPLNDALGIFSQTKWLIVMIGILSGLVVFLLSLLGGRRFSAPISQLYKGAELIAQGNWNLNLEIRTGDEIEQLANQFNRMAAGLKESYSNLEKKIRDRTKELELVNQQLSQAKTKLEAVFRQMADGLLVIDDGGRIIEFNPAMEQLSGWKAYEIKGRYCYEVLQIEDQNGNKLCQNKCPLIEILETNQLVTKTDVTVLNKDGIRIDISYNGVPLLDSCGELSGAVITFQDMRESKELEKLREQFVTMVTHELRAPITNIKGWLSMLMEECNKTISEKEWEILKEIKQNNEYLLNLVNEMLDVSKIEQDSFIVNIKTCNLGRTLRRVASEMKVLAREKGLSLEFLEKELPPVLADEERVVQVLYNLIGNAIKFTNHGKIEIWCEEDKNSLITHISDTGQGIPPANIPRIFDKFFTMQNQQLHKTKGTGLGLYISRLVVERMSGEIWVKSLERKGSTFSFSLPLIPSFQKERPSSVKTTTQS